MNSEHIMSVASLRVAEQALREEPYGRLPALAGTLAIAAMHLERLSAEMEELRETLRALKKGLVDATDQQHRA